MLERLLVAAVLAGLLTGGPAGCSGTGDSQDAGADAVVSDLSSDTEADTGPGDSVEDVPGDSAVPDSPGDVPVERLEIVSGMPAVLGVGEFVDFTFDAIGGVPPYSWSVTKGELPSGTTLDADTGAWAGKPDTAGLAWFVLHVSDSAGSSASEMFGVRIGIPAEDGPLLRRANAYQEIYDARHDWNGFSYNLKYPDDPDGNFGLTTLGDATFQSGQCTMAMAYRDAVLRTPETAAALKRHVDGWRFFQRLTGVPGLIGRSYGLESWPWEPNHHSTGFWPDNPDSHNYRGEGEFEGWVWVGDVSRDQATGAFLGVAAAYDLTRDPAVRATAADFMADLADHVWDNDLAFVDKNGELTKYGNLDGDWWEGFEYPNGLNAACMLAWFKGASHAAVLEGLDDADRFEERYQELVSRGYVDYIRDYMWVYSGYTTKHYNAYMAFENMFHLARLEDDPLLGPQIDAAFRDGLWLNTDDATPNRRGVVEGNPVKTSWYLYSTGDRDPVALWDALHQMAVFPDAPLRDRAVTNSADPSIVKNPDEPTESMYYLPSNRLQPDMVIWHRSTFLLDGGVDSGEERTGCDYLLPYWMGRYYGWIHSAW